MSGALAGLAQYIDSDSDADDASNAAAHLPTTTTSSKANVDASDPDRLKLTTAPTRPKRKLPPLEQDSEQQQYDGDAPSDRNSARIVRGEWLCFCYVEVLIDASLNSCIDRCHRHLQEQLGSDYSVIDLRNSDGSIPDDAEEFAKLSMARTSSPPSTTQRLHVSLTRPFTVRSYERDDYIKTALAQAHKLRTTIASFPFTFSRIAHLSNDDASRHYLVLEVSFGREKFHQLSMGLSTELRRAFRAKSYYNQARFHVSTSCVPSVSTDSKEKEEESLEDRFGTIADEIEAKCGDQLRKCPPLWASRIGIQVGNRVTYVDL
ncbi:hypothetical protein PHSY_001606 [Pseudozyma hubeiensis SY62]|uniref:U6 snRNA phosphodiesterase 1 n=1 Tax=Pseudozyma hubeiensis (strain SY62) TaxID=1305764 RepID=R9NZB2_PSEHS|nr:hypothetical protein PHSY_001606 [Pseudozyma hubeiensis SY62]GAC94037.1 hypothetical protein PHSY_001606 [Pseudozyma hubeiensis SY62]